MNSQAPAIRKGRKFDQVLEGARTVFMADGFDGASVDDIAKAANVSKATLYSYFPDKRLLFLEVAKSECLRQSQHALDVIDRTAPPRQVLRAAGRHILGFITSYFGMQMFRMCVAETERFPEIGRQFYQSGPMVMQREMMNYFAEAAARGELDIEDHGLAAFQFGELCKAEVWQQLVFGMRTEVEERDIHRVVDSAVDVFLARYAAVRDDET